MKKPIVSVVMATYNRKLLLRDQLTSLLCGQTTEQSLYEVIVIDDGSTDGTREFLSLLEHPNLVKIWSKNSGPALARNKGIKRAKGAYIAFTDDDCIVESNWIESVITTFSDDDLAGFHGQTYTDPEQRTPLTHQIECNSWNNAAPTCNAAYRRSILKSVGGFDEQFPYAHNEDADLAWRIMDIGKMRYAPIMKVYHPAVAVPFSKQIKRMKMLISEFYLYKKSPKRYKQYRSSSPWHTIYGQVFFRHQLLNLKFHLGFIKDLRLFITGISISVINWLYLIVLLPSFIRTKKTKNHA